MAYEYAPNLFLKAKSVATRTTCNEMYDPGRDEKPPK